MSLSGCIKRKIKQSSSSSSRQTWSERFNVDYRTRTALMSLSLVGCKIGKINWLKNCTCPRFGDRFKKPDCQAGRQSMCGWVEEERPSFWIARQPKEGGWWWGREGDVGREEVHGGSAQKIFSLPNLSSNFEMTRLQDYDPKSFPYNCKMLASEDVGPPPPPPSGRSKRLIKTP